MIVTKLISQFGSVLSSDEIAEWIFIVTIIGSKIGEEHNIHYIQSLCYYLFQ